MRRAFFVGSSVFALLLLPACILVVGNKADIQPDTMDSANAVRYRSKPGETIRGSGQRATRDVVLEPFHAIHVEGSVDARIRVRPGTYEARVVGDDNLVERIRVEVREGTLHVAWDDDVDARPRESTLVSVYAPGLYQVALTGSCDVNVEGIDSERFELSLTGSGDLSAGGRCTELLASLSGSGDVSAADLVARSVVVQLSGSGDMIVHAEERAEAQISGSGNVLVHGHPAELRSSISGSGDVLTR